MPNPLLMALRERLQTATEPNNDGRISEGELVFVILVLVIAILAFATWERYKSANRK
jgi:hypothetical protein